MNRTTKHDRKKFINELHSKWQKKFRNSQYWLSQEEIDSLDAMDDGLDYPEKYQPKLNGHKVMG